MESLLGFEEEPVVDHGSSSPSSTSSRAFKLVPWLNWEEWDSVRVSLFSNSPDDVESALRRISAWRTRGCLLEVIGVTASIIEIQQKDPYFRKEQRSDALHSDTLLAMLYSMAIMRLVNCVVEKTRKRMEVSIVEAADAIGIPRKLIDVRHEASHRSLPALPLVRSASITAIDWLKFYYWEPQKNAIPFQRNITVNVKREIKSKLHELAFCLKERQSVQSGSSLEKGKRSKHCKQLCGSNKFFSLMAEKLRSSKCDGSKKQITKILKILVRLYSSFSSEVVSVLMEFLLEASSNFSDLVELPKDSQVSPTGPNSLDDWKRVITKFSNKEPELLLTLLKAVIDMIETQEAMKYETGHKHVMSSEYTAEIHQIERLSSSFAWLVENLKGLKPCHHKDSAAEIKVSSTETNLPKAILIELLGKCLLVSALGNKQLMGSAQSLAQLTGDSSLIEKLNKFNFLGSSNFAACEENSFLPNSKNLLRQQEEYLNQAAKKLKLIELGRTKTKIGNTKDVDVRNSSRWNVAKSWNPCPIGLLPRVLGSSGRLPVLDRKDDHIKVLQLLENRDSLELNQYNKKREASCDIQQLDNISVKKIRGTVECCESENDIQQLDNIRVKKIIGTVECCESENEDVSSFEGAKGHLMIGGVWKKVGEEALLAIKSDVRILV